MWVFPRLKRVVEYSYLILIWASHYGPAQKKSISRDFLPVSLVSA